MMGGARTNTLFNERFFTSGTLRLMAVRDDGTAITELAATIDASVFELRGGAAISDLLPTIRQPDPYQNNEDILFPQATADQGQVKGFVLYRAVTTTEGQAPARASVGCYIPTTAFSVQVGDFIRIPFQGLSVRGAVYLLPSQSPPPAASS